MTRRRKTILGITAALAVGVLATPFLFARGGDGFGFRGHFGGHSFGRMAHVLHDLDLTREQKDALRRIHETTREQNAASRAALHDGFVDAAKILLANPQDVAGARAAVATREAAIREMKENALTGVSQALTVLTPEQRAKLSAHLDEHQKQFAR